jgi:LmbE family N-acetylglucosaminyl deacetylase
VVTNGASGSQDPDMTREQLAIIRREEQERASAALGAKEVIFLGYEDAYLEPTIDVRRDIARLIRRLRPELVITHDPSRWYVSPRYINHPDHRAAGEATFGAIMPWANTRLASPELLDEGLEPHQLKALWLTNASEADHYVNIADVLELKLEALRCHESQVGDRVGDFVTERAKQIGAQGGLDYAESFKAFSWG